MTEELWMPEIWEEETFAQTEERPPRRRTARKPGRRLRRGRFRTLCKALILMIAATGVSMLLSGMVSPLPGLVGRGMAEEVTEEWDEAPALSPEAEETEAEAIEHIGPEWPEEAETAQEAEDPPLVTPEPVRLLLTDNPSSPLLPSDIYLPSPTTGETFQYQGDPLPIYADVELRQVQPGDFAWEGDRLRYIGSQYNALFGVDVSSYNNGDHADGLLDWAAAKEDGVEFVIVRIGFRGTSAGQLNEDAYFAVNIDGAMAEGIRTGVYFFSQAVTVEEAIEEADFVIEHLQEHPIDGPVCFDWERDDSSYRVYRVPADMATACAVAFCRRIAMAGYTPVVYESRDTGYKKYDQGALAPYLSWYSKYLDKGSRNPCPDFYYHTDLWQFSKRCAVAGIGKRVDGNLWLLPRDADTAEN